ncbi:MAG: SDR family oxidoreductase [Myxococcota bacterium]
MTTPPAAFVTGFPGFIARRLVHRLLATDDRLHIYALVEQSQVEAAERGLAAMNHHSTGDLGLKGRVELLTGDVAAMDVGLSGEEFQRVTRDTLAVYHLAAVRSLSADRRTAESVNVHGTANILTLARSMTKLERLVHFSSAYVSGDRTGVIMEDELGCGQGFRNTYEATKHQSEVLVENAKKDLPITVVRPAGVVGDSRTGEIDRFDSVYHIGMLLTGAPVELPIPLTGGGHAPMNMAPVDYVVEAIHAIASQAWSLGRTFHIVDPHPIPVRRVYETVAERAGRKLSRYSMPTNLTKALLRIPGLERFASISHQAIDYLDHMVFYNCRNTAYALEGTGIKCPSFEDYVENLMQYVRDHFEREGRWKHAPHD